MIAQFSAGADLDFFIEGFAKFNLFGQTLYITTTHICLSIVFVILVAFAIDKTIIKVQLAIQRMIL